MREFLEPEISREAQSGAPARNAFLQMTLPIFYSNTCFSLKIPYLKSVFHQNCSLRVALNQTIYQKMRKMSVFEVFNKITNFITESVKKPTIYDLLFLSGIYSPKNVNKYPSEIKNQHQRSFFTIGVVFPNIGPILIEGLKC